MAKNEEKENKIKKHFFKEFKAELKKVIWPTPKQLVNNTIAVVTIVLLLAFIVFILDSIFKFVNNQGITKLQNQVIVKIDENKNKETEASKENTDEQTQNNEEKSEEQSSEENTEESNVESSEE
ncbi:MAG: preprotein translocase subunit SecE [Clostridia bacterium]|nr:preprotein translocase subunit SecE [Clostridia bacterium]